MLEIARNMSRAKDMVVAREKRVQQCRDVIKEMEPLGARTLSSRMNPPKKEQSQLHRSN